MSSPFANAVTAAMGAIAGVAGENVIYVRGECSVPLVAVPGQTRAEQQSASGLHAQIVIADWIIAACHLSLDGIFVQPEAGDHIYVPAGASGGAGGWHLYEVSSLDGRSQPWRYSDTGRTRYRIHTKLIKTVDEIPQP